VAAPEALDGEGAVAAKVARVAPQLPVSVEVRGGEEVASQGLYPAWRLPGRRGADELASEARRANRRVVVDVSRQGRRAADTLEADVGGLLRLGKGKRGEQRGDQGRARNRRVGHSCPSQASLLLDGTTQFPGLVFFGRPFQRAPEQIGRASCRERV